jgi:hypothetical protein
MKRFCLFALALLLFISGLSQQRKYEDSLLDKIEDDYYTGNQYSNEVEGVDIYLSLNPTKINVNEVDSLTLIQTGFLSKEEVGNFLHYRIMFAPFEDMMSMQAIPGWSQETLFRFTRLIRENHWYFSKKRQVVSLTNGVHQLQFQVGYNLNREAGYFVLDSGIAPAFSGSPINYVTRYRFEQPNSWQWGITIDKDAGEKFWNSKSKQPDFYSAHLAIEREGLLKNIIIGDFLVNMGQGLLIWESPAFGKGANAMGVKREQDIFKPYRSVGECFFERGVAMKWQKRNAEWDLFFSNRKHDATRHGTDSAGFFVQSLQTSGLHRTLTEVVNRATLGRISVGSSIKIRSGSNYIGFNMITHHFSMPWNPGTEPYRYFYPKGSRFTNASIDYSWTIANAHLFGEEAFSFKGLAISNGLLLAVSKHVSLSLVHRSFTPDYHTFFDNTFQEGGKVANENGYYLGCQYKPNKMYEFNAYIDHYRFPWLQFSSHAPATGNDLLLNMVVNPSKTAKLVFRMRLEDRHVVDVFDPNVASGSNFRSLSLMVHSETALIGAWYLRTRMELRHLRRPDDTRGLGILLYTDLKYKPTLSRFSAEGRISIFNTDQYDSRIYAFEPGVANTGGIGAFYDKGVSGFLMMHWKPSKHFHLTIKYRSSGFWLKASMGEGLERISGNRKAMLNGSLTCEF